MHFMTFFSTLLSLVLPAAAAGNTDISRFFTVDSSCDPSKNPRYDLDLVLDNARSLLREAIAAINVLDDPATGYPGGSPARRFMRNAHQSFGTKYVNTFQKLSQTDKNTMEKVQENYQRVLNALTAGHSDALSKDQNLIVCEPENRYKQTTSMYDIDKTPNVQYPFGGRVSSTYLRKYSVDAHSLFYIPGYLQNNVEKAVQVSSDANDPGPCVNPPGRTELAQTYRFEYRDPNFEFNQVMFCRAFYNNFLLDKDQMNEARKKPETAPSINGRPASNELDNYTSRAGVFIHEMLHLLSPEQDDWADHKFYWKATGRTKQYLPYEAANIYLVANKKNDVTPVDLTPDPLSLPDAYKLFAEACYVVKKFGTKESATNPIKKVRDGLDGGFDNDTMSCVQ